MTIEGYIIRELGERTGTSSYDGSTWRIASYVIETEGTYPKRIAFDVADGQSGRIQRLGIAKDKYMRVWLDIDAHEYQGKWFNQVRCYDARIVDPQIVNLPKKEESEA